MSWKNANTGSLKDAFRKTITCYPGAVNLTDFVSECKMEEAEEAEFIIIKSELFTNEEKKETNQNHFNR